MSERPVADEVRALLAEAAEGTRRARTALRPYYGGWIAIWGGVYTIGYALVALGYPGAESAFGPLVLAGFLLSYGLGARAGGFLQSAAGRGLARLWAGFGAVVLSLALAAPRLTGPVLSLATNALVALALWQTAGLVGSPALAATAAGFAFLNAALFAYFPALYAPILALLGLGALALGLKWVRDGLR